ncbi:MAG: hypothetical protein IPM63_06380 [Acidobacteriota bacterium]|nr:MAG: hypothetical protein IPM63_06380 [Acidobacteriota bacterium]
MIDYRIKAKALAASSLLIFALSIQIRAQDEPADQNFHGLPAGSEIKVTMDNEINSKSSSVDDTFTVTISEPIEIDGIVVLPIGAVIEGRVTKVRPASAGRTDGILEVVFETLFIDAERKRDIEGLIERDAADEQSNTGDILIALGSTAAGGILGSAVGGGKGALIGAGIGAGGGLGAVLLKKGAEARIRENEEFRVRLTKPVSLPVRGY